MTDTVHAHLLEGLEFDATPEQLLRKVRMEPGDGLEEDVARLVVEAAAVARPRAYYRLAFPVLVDEERVHCEEVELRSRVLRVNLATAGRVFVYLASCGPELDAWAHGKTDPLEQYWADAVKELALGVAVRALNRDIAARYRPGPTSAMAPGSLADWPIQQQRPLFQLLGEGAGLVGVQLSPSYLMLPNKSISGIRVPRQESFESCMLCPRADCPNRRAPYDPALYEQQYAGATHPD